MKHEQIKAKEMELLEARSQPLRHYMMDNVIPVLSEAIIDLTRTLPEDPIDHLSKFLFKNSSRVE